MIKFALIPCLLVLLSISSLAYPMDYLSDMDKTLITMRLVDDNLVYTDVSEVNKLFSMATQQVGSDKNQFAVDNDNLSVRSVRLTPYLMSFDFQYNGYLSDSKKRQLRDSFLSTDEIEDSCDEFYFKDKFMQANDVTTVLTVSDTDDEVVFNLVLNSETCE